MDHAEILARLETVIAGRLEADPASSYVARLHAKGLGKIAQKVGEEATETVIAALTGNDADLTGEAADLLFHLLVLLGERGITLDAVLAELEAREGTSGLDEKAGRGS